MVDIDIQDSVCLNEEEVLVSMQSIFRNAGQGP